MCWLELSKGFITNNLFVKRVLFSCLWNIHEQEHCFLKCIYLKCSSGYFKWITEGLACKWFPLFSCTWANKPPGIDCFARLLRQQHPGCANRVWASVCVNATAGASSAPPWATLSPGFSQALGPLKCDRSTHCRGGVNAAERQSH